MGGFGGGSWGGGPWGGSGSSGVEPVTADEVLTLTESVSVSVALRLTGAVALTPFLVEATFSQALDPSFPAHLLHSNYSIPSLLVTNVVYGPAPNSIWVITTEQIIAPYVLTVTTARSTFGDLLQPPSQTASFTGFPVAPRFLATAQSDRKVVLLFATAMQQDAAFVNPSNYTIRDFNGTAVPVTSVTPEGPLPIMRAVLSLGSSLAKGGYYVADVDPSVHTSGGLSIAPRTDIFQWASMEAPIFTGPIVIPITDFSGEVTTGLLGQPAGQLFFSPALNVSAANSIIQVDEVSLCTRAYDVYEFPQLIDPSPLFTFGSGGPGGVLGAANVLWSSAERQGIARIELTDHPADTLPDPTDGPADATLVEPIDITRAAFLNDSRWVLYPPGLATTFITADNLTPIGPGPTTNINLEP